MKEKPNSRRLRVINSQIKDLHNDVANLSEALVDREPEDCIAFIDSIRIKLNILKEQILKSEII